MSNNKLGHEMSNLLKVQFMNGSALYYSKEDTGSSLLTIIQTFQINTPADVLLWLTIIYTLLQVIKIANFGKLFRELKIQYEILRIRLGEYFKKGNNNESS
jgi:hypothetical protein